MSKTFIASVWSPFAKLHMALYETALNSLSYQNQVKDLLLFAVVCCCLLQSLRAIVGNYDHMISNTDKVSIVLTLLYDEST